jgi:hypothetical protein
MGFKWFKHLQSVTHTTVHFPNLMRPQVELWAEMLPPNCVSASDQVEKAFFP